MSWDAAHRSAGLRALMHMATTTRRVRLEKRLTQRELAGMVGVDRTALQRWESGRAWPSDERLVRLAEALGRDAADFYLLVDGYGGRFSCGLWDYRIEDHGHDTPCWIWQRSIGPEGYGMTLRGGAGSAHRWYFLERHGSIPVGLVLDHLCRVRPCCNPDHLEPVTQRENVWRAPRVAERTHCAHGHELTPENTYIATSGGRHGRVCRTCRADSQRRCDARRREGLAA